LFQQLFGPWLAKLYTNFWFSHPTVNSTILCCQYTKGSTSTEDEQAQIEVDNKFTTSIFVSVLQNIFASSEQNSWICSSRFYLSVLYHTTYANTYSKVSQTSIVNTTTERNLHCPSRRKTVQLLLEFYWNQFDSYFFFIQYKKNQSCYAK
jgi:hypothetical protein